MVVSVATVVVVSPGMLVIVNIPAELDVIVFVAVVVWSPAGVSGSPVTAGS